MKCMVGTRVNEQGSLLERVLMDGHNVLLQVLEFTIMYIPIESQFYGVLCNGAQMANNPLVLAYISTVEWMPQ